MHAYHASSTYGQTHIIGARSNPRSILQDRGAEALGGAAAQLAFNLSWAVNILLFGVKLWAYAVSDSKAVLVRRPLPNAPVNYSSVALGDRKGLQWGRACHQKLHFPFFCASPRSRTFNCVILPIASWHTRHAAETDTEACASGVQWLPRVCPLCALAAHPAAWQVHDICPGPCPEVHCGIAQPAGETRAGAGTISAIRGLPARLERS